MVFAFGHQRPQIGAGEPIRRAASATDNKSSVLLIREFTAMKSGELSLGVMLSTSRTSKAIVQIFGCRTLRFSGCGISPQPQHIANFAHAVRTLSIQCTKRPFANNLFPLATFH
jgi:hypothetical protein